MIDKRIFGHAGEKDVFLYSLSDGEKLRMQAINYGCAIVRIELKDKNGWKDVVLGFDDLASYIHQKYYIGIVIGRCANRIENASFRLDGEKLRLSANEGAHHLHGGFTGFHDRVWEEEAVTENSVTFHCFSPDKEEGYPGNLHAWVTYKLDGGKIEIEYRAKSDRDTIVNITNHSYFNLNGHGGLILSHTLHVLADAYTKVDQDCLTTGVISPVDGTPFDLREPRTIGPLLKSSHEQMVFGSGFNHNLVLRKGLGMDEPSVILTDPDSGTSMKVYTDQPGVQVYTANYLDGTLVGKDGVHYRQYGSVCLETQNFPNAANMPQFPSPVLKKDEEYRKKTIFAFE